jgi:hypothetical protein
MKSLMCVVFMILLSSMALAGELFGTITEAGKPVPEGTRIEITIAGKSFTGATDKLGTYHVQAAEKGKGTLTAYYKNQKPTFDVFSFEKATRYDFTVETVEGKLTLKRK